jgi:hypothetical protein
MQVEERKISENPSSRGEAKNSYTQLQTKTCRSLKDQTQSEKTSSILNISFNDYIREKHEWID